MSASAESPLPPADRCARCEAPLAHDQRYCISCGTRRMPLPADVAARLGELADPGGEPAAGGPGPEGEGDAESAAPVPAPGERDHLRDFIPLARGAAVSILLMLGVGSVIGAATSPGGVTSLAKTVVVAFSPALAPPTTLASSGGSGSGGGSGGAGGSGSGGGGGGSGGGAVASAPAQTTRTVTIPAGTGTSGSSGTGSTTSTSTTPAASTSLPPIRHVWEIVLSDQGYGQSFGDPSNDPYLARTLVKQGELVTQYDAVASSPLANEVALVSGQGPTPQTLENCPQYSDIVPGSTGKLAQAIGSGCLYPSSTQTLGQQIAIDGLTWRAYVQGVGRHGSAPATTTSTTTSTTATAPAATPTTAATTTATTTTTAAPAPAPTTDGATTSATTTSGSTTSSSTTTGSTTSATPPVADTTAAASCPHPAQDAADPTQSATAADGYVTWSNPWVYFHSVVNSAPGCAQDDVGLPALARDLRTEKATPAFSYIAADPCDDGSSVPCRPGAKAGLRQADRFLRAIVPEIERSPAYRANGLILVTFAEAPQSGPDWSTASCCGQPTFPNLPATSTSTTSTSATTSAAATTSTATTPATGTEPTTTTTTATTTETVPATTGTETTGTTAGTTGTTTCPASTTGASATTTTSTTTAATTGTTTSTTTPTCAPAIVGDPPGGGQVGLLMISPYVPAGKLDPIDVYNHFALLKSIEDLFGLPHLGYAADPQVPSFTPSLFVARHGGS